jgi:hypothetical protein
MLRDDDTISCSGLLTLAVDPAFVRFGKKKADETALTQNFQINIASLRTTP